MGGSSIAVLGTGIMGAPIARNLARAGFAVRAWNRTREKAAPLAAGGVTVTDSPAAAARGADFVLTMLTDGKTVESSMTGAAGTLAAMSPTAIWLQCSTVGIAATEHLADLAAQAGIAFVDAPVLGTKKPAEDAKLVVLASGDPTLDARCQPVFDAIGRCPQWLGDAGAGTRLKLVMNSWVLAITSATAEAIALSEGLGVDPQLFLSSLAGTQLDSAYAHLKGGAMLAGDFTPSFPVASAAKDSGLILEAAQSCGIAPDVIGAVRAKFARALKQGRGDEDMAAVYAVTVMR